MKITFVFSEIQSLVKFRTGREIVLSAIDERTVKAEAKVSVKVPFIGEIEKNIEVNVSVERLDGTNVYLRYDNGIGTDMIINGLFIFLSSTPAMKIVEKAQKNGIVIHLSEIKEARRVLDMLELTSIIFQNNSVVIEGRFK